MLRGCHEIKILNLDYPIFARKKGERGKIKEKKKRKGRINLKTSVKLKKLTLLHCIDLRNTTNEILQHGHYYSVQNCSGIAALFEKFQRHHPVFHWKKNNWRTKTNPPDIQVCLTTPPQNIEDIETNHSIQTPNAFFIGKIISWGPLTEISTDILRFRHRAWNTTNDFFLVNRLFSFSSELGQILHFHSNLRNEKIFEMRIQRFCLGTWLWSEKPSQNWAK